MKARLDEMLAIMAPFTCNETGISYDGWMLQSKEISHRNSSSCSQLIIIIIIIVIIDTTSSSYDGIMSSRCFPAQYSGHYNLPIQHLPVLALLWSPSAIFIINQQLLRGFVRKFREGTSSYWNMTFHKVKSDHHVRGLGSSANKDEGRRCGSHARNLRRCLSIEMRSTGGYSDSMLTLRF